MLPTQMLKALITSKPKLINRKSPDLRCDMDVLFVNFVTENYSGCADMPSHHINQIKIKSRQSGYWR
jgi:hypothetical protein